MRHPQFRTALVALIAFVALATLMWVRFLDEFPKNGEVPAPGASVSPTPAPIPESLVPSPSPTETGELYPSAENPAAVVAKYRRLDDDFEKVITRLPVVSDGTKKLPPAPFLIDGCEGESCGFVENLTLTCESKFVSDPHPKGALAFTLPEKTTLQKARIFTLIRQIGKARLKGEKRDIHVLSYSSDGDWLTWENGELGSYSEWRDGNAKRFRAPVRESWLFAEDDEGRRGWMKIALPEEGKPAPACPFRWGI